MTDTYTAAYVAQFRRNLAAAQRARARSIVTWQQWDKARYHNDGIPPCAAPWTTAFADMQWARRSLMVARGLYR